jgi:transposase
MSMGRRRPQQQEFWVATQEMAAAPRHVFYDRLNGLLDEAGFDRFCEDLCESYYDVTGRDSIPPGRYFRMLLVGYFEGIDSQRGIAWRCADSLSLRKFLFLAMHEESPDHSTLSKTGDRLPLEIHSQVFEFVLSVAREKKLLRDGRLCVGVDSTTLEANAAMKSIVRKDSGEDWKAYVKRLMQEAGLIDDDDDPTDDELRRFDKSRSGKKVSNKDWESPADPDARIIRMKNGTTHPGYKAEHVVDLQSEIIVSAQVYHGTDGDAQTLLQSTATAQRHLAEAGSAATVREVTADRGYHAVQTLADCREAGMRSYIPERQTGRRNWTGRSLEEEEAFRANRRRMRGARGKQLQRRRSEVVERSFAHVCETGAARRTWLRGLEKVNKRYLITVAARNLSLVMRRLFGVGTPRSLQGCWRAFAAVLAAFDSAVRPLIQPLIALKTALVGLKPAISDDFQIRTGSATGLIVLHLKQTSSRIPATAV